MLDVVSRKSIMIIAGLNPRVPHRTSVEAEGGMETS